MDIEIFKQLIDAVDNADPQDGRYRNFGPEIESMLDGEVQLLMDELEARSGELAAERQPVLEFIFAALTSRSRKGGLGGEAYSEDAGRLRDSIRAIYLDQPEASNIRNYLLGWLASLDDQSGAEFPAVDLFVELLVENPPRHSRGIVVAFQPFFAENSMGAVHAFPKLLDAIQHVELAAAVIDLANFLTRESYLEVHPAGDRRAGLISTLQALTKQLGEIETGQLPKQADPARISEQIENSVALIVSLCDALALIGDQTAIPKLEEALELKHRRIRTEAAAALFRLGEESAKQHLLGMLNEPVSRLRVIAYADELDFSDEIDPQWTTDERQAESKLALWLAQPTQMGFAPSQVDVVDRRELHWPGFNDPVDCFLLEYQFESAAGTFKNVGITGPMTYVFAADLTSINRFDQYAAFAGWQAAHEDLFEIPYDKACVAFRRDTEARLRDIENEGFQEINPLFLGNFFGEHVLVCNAVKNRVSGQVIADGEETYWFDSCSEEAPVCGELAYCIYKGRRLLSHFNPLMDENLEQVE